MKRFSKRLGTAVLVGMMSSTAMATAPKVDETTDNTATKANISPNEIVVTAMKREERLRDVPATLLVRSVESLETSGVRAPTDLGTAFPGLTFAAAAQQAQPAIRGVTTLAASGNVDNPVALYIDGVYTPGQAGNNGFDLAFVSNISVLKGPQGTVFGRNVVGGAILVTTRDPELNELTGFVSGTFSHFGGGRSKNALNNEARLFVSVPLVEDRLAASIAVSRSLNEGYLRNVSPGADERYGERRNYNIQGKLLWEPNNDIRILFNARHVDQHLEYGGSTGLGVARSLNFPDAVIADEPWEVAADSNPGTVELKATSISLTADFETDIGKFSSISAYQSISSPTSLDSDGAYSPACTAVFQCLGLNFNFGIPTVLSQEINYSSKKFGRFSIVAGVIGFHKRNATTVFLNETIFSSERYTSAYSFAGFGEVTYDITDRLSAIAGVRYTFDAESRFGRNSKQTFDFSPTEHQSWDAVTKRFSLRYRASDSLNVYASYNEGYQAGIITTSSFNSSTGAPLPPLDPVEPQLLTAYEIGAKFGTSDISLNVAGFLYNYKDILVQRYSSTLVPLLELSNAAKAQIIGFDADWNIRLAEGLRLTGGVSWMPQAKYLDFQNAQIFVKSGNVAVAPFPGVDLTGSRLLRSPKLTASSTIEYQTNAGGGDWVFSLSHYHSSLYTTQIGQENFQKTYDTLGAQISFEPNNLPVTFTVFGRNLTNKAYLTGTVASNAAYRYYYAAPREIGLTAKFTF